MFFLMYDAVKTHEDANMTASGNRTRPLQDDEEEKMAYTKPSDHYHMSAETRNKLNVFSWPGEELNDDEACQVSLLICIISRILFPMPVRVFYHDFSIIYSAVY
jgi:hypothetical protein